MQTEYILSWVISALIVGYIWKRLNLSFVSGVIWSLVLSPVVSLIIGLVWFGVNKSKKKTPNSQPAPQINEPVQ